jgi:hypothetical protein
MTIISHSVSVLCLWAIVGLTNNARVVERTNMDDNVRRRIAEAAAAENSWSVGEVQIEENEQLRRPSCSFYVARHKTRPLSYVRNYALLGQQQILGTGDGKSVANILDQCSGDAAAGWWAEIVTRFHEELGGGVVLHDENTRPELTRQFTRAGKTFSGPTLDRQNRSVRYFLLNPETRAVYQVEANRNSSGTVAVSKTKVF